MPEVKKPLAKAFRWFVGPYRRRRGWTYAEALVQWRRLRRRLSPQGIQNWLSWLRTLSDIRRRAHAAAKRAKKGMAAEKTLRKKLYSDAIRLRRARKRIAREKDRKKRLKTRIRLDKTGRPLIKKRVVRYTKKRRIRKVEYVDVPKSERSYFKGTVTPAGAEWLVVGVDWPTGTAEQVLRIISERPRKFHSVRIWYELLPPGRAVPEDLSRLLPAKTDITVEPSSDYRDGMVYGDWHGFFRAGDIRSTGELEDALTNWAGEDDKSALRRGYGTYDNRTLPLLIEIRRYDTK